MTTNAPPVAPDAPPAPPVRALPEGDTRQGTVRRLYFYLVALISATASLIAFDSLIAALVDAWFTGPALAVISGPGYLRSTIAGSVGVLVVAAPIFLLHWAVIQARAAAATPAGAIERSAALRKFFLYASSAIALGLLLARTYDLLAGVAQLALGLPPAASDLLPGAWLRSLLAALAAGALLWYWQTVARRDGDFGLEQGWAAAWRRLFLAWVILVGLALVVFGSAGLLAALLHWGIDRLAPAASSNWFALRAGTALAQLLLGIVTARTGLQVWHDVTVRRPAEESSALLRLFLYVTVVGGALATLVPAAIVLRLVLIWIFAGFNRTPLELLEMLVTPLGFIPAGVLIWRRFWQVVHEMEARAGVSAEAATVRRIYFYAVAATGLTLLWLGLNNVVQVLLDAWLTAAQLKDAAFWQQPLATGLSLLAVGAPVWALHWQAAQRVARADTLDGAAERASLPRRVYLYGVAFVGAILILYYLALVLYRLFLRLLGDTTSALFSAQMAEELARAAIAAVLWGVHLVALRADGGRVPTAPSAAPPDAPPFDPAQQRAALDAEIADLERTLEHLRAQRAALKQ